MKSLAVSWLKQRNFDGYTLARCGPEIAVELRRGQTSLDDYEAGPAQRRADALAEFREPHQHYQKGVIVEVQYKNTGKDIRAVTDDYLNAGYSVIWMSEDDFGSDRCLLDQHDMEARTMTVYYREYNFNPYPP